MTLQHQHSAAFVPRPFSNERVANVERNILRRRPLLPASVVRREAECFAGARAEADGVTYLIRGNSTKRDFNQALDGSMPFSFDAVAELPEHGHAGARVLLALVTPVLRDIAHRPMKDAAEPLRLDAASADFIETAGEYSAALIGALADQHLNDEERRRLDALLSKLEGLLASARAAVRRS